MLDGIFASRKDPRPACGILKEETGVHAFEFTTGSIRERQK
jgi:hypothetical protein